MNTDIDTSDAGKASTMRFEPMRLDRKDIDLTHYIDAFELIEDLVKRSMANERKE